MLVDIIRQAMPFRLDGDPSHNLDQVPLGVGGRPVVQLAEDERQLGGDLKMVDTCDCARDAFLFVALRFGFGAFAGKLLCFGATEEFNLRKDGTAINTWTLVF
jgi:hypothetical protein